MPTYTWVCADPNCGASLDVTTSINDRNEPQTCHCGLPMERAISPMSFSIKGHKTPKLTRGRTE